MKTEKSLLPDAAFYVSMEPNVAPPAAQQVNVTRRGDGTCGDTTPKWNLSRTVTHPDGSPWKFKRNVANPLRRLLKGESNSRGARSRRINRPIRRTATTEFFNNSKRNYSSQGEYLNNSGYYDFKELSAADGAERRYDKSNIWINGASLFTPPSSQSQIKEK